MSVNPRHVQPGMEVVTYDGETVGTVKEARAEDFMLNRPLLPDIAIPYDVIQVIVNETPTEASPSRIILGVSANELLNLG